LKAYLMTRGTARDLDHAYLGDAPPSVWWTPVSRWLDLETAELVVCRQAGSVGILVSGIPSARRDIVGRAIRLTIVLDEADSDPDLARRLAWAALDDRLRAALGNYLDEVFDADTVDGILSGTRDPGDVADSLARVLKDTRWTPEAVEVDPGADRDGPWVGPVADAAARRAFLARVDRVVGHADGILLASHALTSAAGAGGAAGTVGSNGAILLHETHLTQIESLGKATPLRTDTRARRGIDRRLLVAAAIGMVAAAVVWWAIR
jgi:hypothetical protein